MSDLTLGQKRVRIDFNVAPEGDIATAVHDFKDASARLIDACEELKATGNPEGIRLAALAQTAFEEGAMWAVKAVTL